MDWQSSGRHDEFRYVLVDRTTMQEVQNLDMFVDGGTVEYDDLTTMKVSGSLPFVELPNIGFNYLRVYSISRLGNETEEVLHGTFLVATPSSEIKWGTRTGTASMYSLLQIASDAALYEPVSIPEETKAINYATDILKSLGLSVIADQSDMRLSTTANYDAGTSVLEIANDFCTIAGFDSPSVDVAGNVCLYRYHDPAVKEPSIELVNDERCVYNPSVHYEYDIFSIPNVVSVIMSNEDEAMTAIAKNTDPLSIYSTVRRGREIVYTETVRDIEDMEALQALAERRLAEKSSAVESIDVSHSFLPYKTGEVARFVYTGDDYGFFDGRSSHTKEDFNFTGVAVKKQIKLVPGMPCETCFRRFVRG